MLWFASRLLSSIFSLTPNRSSKKVTADSTPYHTISVSSSFTTLVDDEASDCPKTGNVFLCRHGTVGYPSKCHMKGHNTGMKRERSDATLCFSEISSDYEACGAFVDAEHTLPPEKRRRGVLETPYIRPFPHNLRDPHIQIPSSEYVPTGVPSSGETPQTKAQCRRIELSNTPSQHGVNCATSLSGSDLRHFSSHIVGSALLDSSPSLPECSDSQGEPPSEGSLEPAHSQTHEVAHDVTLSRSDCPLGVHNAACNGICPAQPASSRPPSFSFSEPVDTHSLEPSSRPAAPEGEATRIEITFEKLHNELLSSREHGSLIQDVAQRISTGPRWLTAYHAYKETLRWTRFSSGAGFRKNRFMDLMNLVVEEAPGCGLSVPYTHQLRYDRYHYDSSEWSPEKSSEDGSSRSGSRDSKASKQSASSVCSCKHSPPQSHDE